MYRREARTPRLAVGLLGEQLEFLFALAGSRFGNLAVVLGVNDEHRAPQFGTNLFEVRANFITVARVVHHDEQHGLFTERLVFGVALLPFLDAKLEIVVVFLGENGAFLFDEFCLARRVRQNGMLDDVLVNRFHERVIAYGLNEDRAVVVARCCGHVHLQGEAAVLLQHPVMNVLNGFEPRHLRIVDVVRLVVEDSQLLNFTDDFAKISLAIGGLASGLRAERREEVIAQVTVFKRRVGNITKKHAVDVCEKQIPGVAHDPDIILDVQRKLEIIAPVAALVSVVRQNGIVEENPQAVKVGAQPIKHDDVRRDDQKIARER